MFHTPYTMGEPAFSHILFTNHSLLFDPFSRFLIIYGIAYAERSFRLPQAGQSIISAEEVSV
jgi:hypothetical protein